ncbi:MAG: glycosyltransferase family 2 protein [Leptolyngbya sp. SIO3F4]|nr:glycosyltransferase family 2 protein [Leptolyngbya sp. SIO3F4]
MLSHEKVGIVLATYNPNVDFLKKQLKSIQEQTFSQWICHIVDDRSQPSIRLAITEIVKTDTRFICHFYDENVGSYHNFERGLNCVKTDNTLTSIAFADQDDIWHAAKLETLLVALNREQKVLVHSDLALIDASAQVLHPSVWSFEGRYPEKLTSEFLLLRNTVTGCTILFRTFLLSIILPFPTQTRERWYHDHWIALMATTLGPIGHVRTPLVQYRQHGTNVVGALQDTGTLCRELQLWLRKGLPIKLESYGVHRDLSYAFYQRLYRNNSQYLKQSTLSKYLEKKNPFDQGEIDGGLAILKLGWHAYCVGYCPPGITLRIWLGKLISDVSILFSSFL